MAEKQGWIKLDRSIMNHWIYEDAEMLKAWIDLLLSCNHKDNKILFDAHPIVIKRGQYMTSIRKLSNRWGWSRARVVRFLDTLEEDGMITRKSDTKKTLLTIENYGFYQGIEATNKATDVATDVTQTRMIKNGKNNIYRLNPQNNYKQMMTNDICYADYEEELLKNK